MNTHDQLRPSTPRRRLALRVAVGLLLLTAIGTGSAIGFIPISFNENTAPFFWFEASFQDIDFVINADGSDDISDDSEEAAIRLAFQEWEDVPGAFISFVEDTSAGARAIKRTNTADHVVFFDENNSSGFFNGNSSVIAVTPLLADIATGRIQDADIIFNGDDQSFSVDQTSGTFDVQAIATHEIGHFIGLDHEPSLRATLFQAAGATQIHARSLSTDDETGVAVTYPENAFIFGTGSISGNVVDGNDAPVRAAHICATDSDGLFAASTVTDANGDYQLDGLAPDIYTVHCEPLDEPTGVGDISRLNAADTDFTTAEQANIDVGAGDDESVDFVVADLNAAGARLDVLSVLPSERVRGTASFTLRVGLAGFEPGNIDFTISGDGIVPGPVAFAGNTATAVVTVAANATPGIRNIRVTNDDNEVAFMTGGFEVLLAPPNAGVVVPNLVDVAAGTTVQIQGQDFVDGAHVVIGGELIADNDVNFVNATRIDVDLPTNLDAGQLDVVVINPDGQQDVLANGLEAVVAPVIDEVDPTTASAQGGTTIFIRGSNFVDGLTVDFDGVPAQVVDVLSNEIEVVADVIPPGTADVTVTNPGGQSDTLNNAVDFIDEPAVEVDDVDPDSGPRRGLSLVTVNGDGFLAGARVFFDAEEAGDVEVVSGQEIICITPAGSGSVDVRVRNPSGLEGLAKNAFTYVNGAGGGGGGGGGCGAPATASVGPADLTGSLGPIALLLAIFWVLGITRRRS